MHRSSTPAPGVAVAVVSDNAETLDDLVRYLCDVGIGARGTRSLDQGCDMVAASRSVLVIFPDDFPTIKVFAVLSALKERRPSTLPVLVTRDFRRFASIEGAVVIPKPVWGWTILDAVRTGLDRTV
jgi:hypothetical protein